MYQQDTGLLDVRRATAAHIARARELGVTFMPHTAVTDIRSADGHVTLATDGGDFTAEHVIVCVASWLPRLSGALDLGWEVTLSEEQVTYFATPHLRQFMPDRFPVWIWHGPDFFYGFPVYGEVAVKVSRDLRGAWTTLEERSYEIDHAEEAYLQRFLETHLPDAVGPILTSKACVYDLPPDRDFVIDLVPGHERIALAVGAGHAAKFAGLIGRILAQLSLDGATDYPVAPFALDRPALTDPTFPARVPAGGRRDCADRPSGRATGRRSGLSRLTLFTAVAVGAWSEDRSAPIGSSHEPRLGRRLRADHDATRSPLDRRAGTRDGHAPRTARDRQAVCFSRAVSAVGTGSGAGGRVGLGSPVRCS